MSSYFLCPDVYLCVTDDCVVLLNLSRDQYIAIPPARSNHLVGHVQDWPHLEWVGPPEDDAPDPEAGKKLLFEMIAAGLVTVVEAPGRALSGAALPNAESSLMDNDAPPRIDGLVCLYLLLAWLRALLLLRFRPLQQIVQRVRNRKARRNAGSVDLQAAQRYVSAFRSLRPLLYGAHRKCLLDSLVMIEFLAFHGIYATWVFGVQTGPFAAHCWVQIGSTLCNDIPDNARRFTPILVV